MQIKQANRPHRRIVLEKTRGSNNMANSIRVPISPRKASIYKGLLPLGKTNMPAILYYISGTDIVTKYTRVNKWKPLAVLVYREKNIRKRLHLEARNGIINYKQLIKINSQNSTLNDSGLRAIPTKFKQLITRKVIMHYSYDRLSVSDVAKLLDTESTYIYKLVREGQLKPCSTNPIRIERIQVHFYLNKRLPSQFTTEWKHKPKEANQWTA